MKIGISTFNKVHQQRSLHSLDVFFAALKIRRCAWRYTFKKGIT